MKGFIAAAALSLFSLALVDGARAQGVGTQPITGTGTAVGQKSVFQVRTGFSGGKEGVETFGPTATVLLQCRRRADPKGDNDFVVTAADRSGAALSVGVGDSCADALRELLDQGMFIAGVTDLGGNTALYTLVRVLP